MPSANVAFELCPPRELALPRALRGAAHATLLAASLCLMEAWSAEAKSSKTPLSVAPSDRAGFKLLPPGKTGVDFTNHLSDAMAEKNRILENGSGVALGDIDGDGFCDIYLCRLQGPNALYRNLGNWKFREMAAEAGVACGDQFSTGAVFTDVDGDGDLDLLVNSLGGGTRLFRNDGKGHFTEDLNSGLLRKSGATSMALADVDGDGDLDLYVVNYRSDTIRDGPVPGYSVTRVGDKTVVNPPERFAIQQTRNGPALVENGEPDVLYLNDGKGHFTPVSWTAGAFLDEDGRPLAEPPRHWGLSAMFHDLNGDHIPDLYVCNDFLLSPDDIWLGDGRGHFRRIAKLAIRNTSWSSMSVDVGDINRDGWPDVFVVDMLARDHSKRETQRANAELNSVGPRLPGQIEDRPQNFRNTLFLNQKDGTFAEIAQLAGAQATDWSWSAAFLDVDLDGYEDLLITTGNAHDIQDADTSNAVAGLLQMPVDQRPKTLLRYPPLRTAKVALRNRRDLTFAEAGKAWGFDDIGVANGMALADLDNDGDLDVVVNQLNGPAGVYENIGSQPRVAVRLVGKAPNTRAAGAFVELFATNFVTQSKEIVSGGRYLSGDSPAVCFAAPTQTAMGLRVRWPNGQTTRISDVERNILYTVDESDAVMEPPEAAPAVAVSPLFQDVSVKLNHSHFETLFDDFGKQPLLPNRLSQLGPGVAWGDWDGDGWPDLAIGSGRGGKIAFYRNDRAGGFAKMANTNLLRGDAAGLVPLPGGAGGQRLLAAVMNFESPVNIPPLQLFRLEKEEWLFEEPAGPQTASAGPICLGDLDQDGDLDLFVGGRFLPGRYPESAPSAVYRNESGRFRLDREFSASLGETGPVSGAIFTDLNGDGQCELALAIDGGPIRIFFRDKGRFVERTALYGLDKFLGKWNGIAAGDFDGDGRIDFVASNWGRNTKYQRFLERPMHIFHGDFDGDGVGEIVECHYAPELGKEVPWRSLVSLSRSFPFLQQSFPTFAAYSVAGVSEIFGDWLPKAGKVTITTFDSLVFLNRGDHFEARPLPVEAQFAPAFATVVADFNGDGLEDVFLSQNFFATHGDTSRLDGGRGLLLLGKGDGAFDPMPAPQSGVAIYGEQRGAAAADYDRDGRVDLVVSQNGAQTILLRNAKANPGLRVRLSGKTGNPSGIGAQMRWKSGDKTGPVREVRAGSGYWSCDDPVQVVAIPKRECQLAVRWPGGRETITTIPRNAREIEVREP